MASWKVATVGGIPVKVHWSLLLVLPFFAYVMGVNYFPPDDAVSGVGLAWGGALAVTLFLSVLIHEFSHSFMAIRLGGKVESILLMPLGGVSQMERSPERPRDEFVMTLVGPLTNFVIAAPVLALHFLDVVPARMTGLQAYIQWTGWLNVALGAFNLFLPAFPMDGGRLLRSALASRMGARRATRIAAMVGRVLALALGFLGILTLPAGLWLMLIAFFIYVGAGAEESSTRVRDLLKDLTAQDIMSAEHVAVAPEDTLEDVHGTMLRTRHVAFPVVKDGRVVGCLGLGDMADVERDRLTTVRVRDVMQGEVPHVAPDRPAEETLRLIQQSPHHHAVVVQNEQIMGLISGTDVERLVQVLDVLGRSQE